MFFIYCSIAEAKELHNLLQPFLLRRVKSEVVLDLPQRSEVVLYHGMSALQKKYYKAILTKDLGELKFVWFAFVLRQRPYHWVSARKMYLQCFKHWSYVFLALSHRYESSCIQWVYYPGAISCNKVSATHLKIVHLEMKSMGVHFSNQSGTWLKIVVAVIVARVTCPITFTFTVVIIKSPRYTGGDFIFLYQFVRRRRHRRPQIFVHVITFEQFFGFLSFLARLLALTCRLHD